MLQRCEAGKVAEAKTRRPVKVTKTRAVLYDGKFECIGVTVDNADYILDQSIAGLLKGSRDAWKTHYTSHNPLLTSSSPQ